MSTIAVDVGGTHTDLYGWLSDEQRAVHEKVPTTTGGPTEGVMNALQSADLDLSAIETFMHGSTIATNAVIEGDYPVTPLITTEGFRDLIEIKTGITRPPTSTPIPSGDFDARSWRSERRSIS